MRALFLLVTSLSRESKSRKSKKCCFQEEQLHVDSDFYGNVFPRNRLQLDIKVKSTY